MCTCPPPHSGPVTASLPGQPHRLGGPGEAEGLHFCPRAGQGGEKQHSRVTAGTGWGPQVNPWTEQEVPTRSGGKVAPGEPCVDPLRLVPPPPPPEATGGVAGGKEALILLQKTNHSFLVLGNPALSGGRGPARQNRAERVQVLRSGPSKHTPVSCHTPHSSSHFLFPPEPTLHRLRKRRKGTVDSRPWAGHTQGPLRRSQEDSHCSPGDSCVKNRLERPRPSSAC